MATAPVDECVEVVACEDKVMNRHAGIGVVRYDSVGGGEVAFGDLADAVGGLSDPIRLRTPS